MQGQKIGPNILILTARYGAGHIKVAEALKIGLERRGVASITILDFFDHVAPRLNKAVRTLHRETTKHAPKLYGAFYRAMSGIENGSWLQDQLDRFGLDDLIGCLDEHSPDIVVCTYPIPAGLLCKLKNTGRYRGSIVTVITDYRAHAQWIQKDIDLYLVAQSGLRDDLIGRGVDAGRIAVTGIPIHPSFAEASTAAPGDFGLKADTPVVTVMANGYSRDNLLKLAKTCAGLPGGAQVAVVCGGDEDLKEKLISAYKGDDRVVPLGFVDRMDNLMALSDVLVSKAGGITCSEAVARRLPIVVWRPVPGQEAENVEVLSAGGVLKAAATLVDLADIVGRLISSAQDRGQMRQAAEKFGPPNPALAGAEQILALFAAVAS